MYGYENYPFSAEIQIVHSHRVLYLTVLEARINKWSDIYKLVQNFKLQNPQMRTL